MTNDTYLGLAARYQTANVTPTAHWWGYSNNLYLRTGLSNGDNTENYTSADYFGTYVTYDERRIGTDNVEMWVEGDLVLANFENIPYAGLPTYFQAPSGEQLYIDWVLLRKVAAIEPRTTLGGQKLNQPAAWGVVETWTGTVEATAAWQLCFLVYIKSFDF